MTETPQKRSKTGNARFPLTVGFIAAILLVAGLGYWGVEARIAGAVVSSGAIEVESNRQVVQHPEGGVVGAILARDGDVVEAGQVLIRFDGIRLRSELSIVERQLYEILSRSARLEAERDGQDEIAFPDELVIAGRTDPGVARQMTGEERLFASRMTALAQETEQLQEQIAQIENRIEGTESQLVALNQQRDLIAEELVSQQSLLERGLAQAARVLELRSEEASLRGQIGKLNADISEMRGQIAGIRIELVKQSTERQEEAISLLREIQFSEIELSERRLSLLDTLSRLEVRAPTSGIVYGSQVFALSSVVQPGAPIMYVIPQDQPLVIASRIDTIHIDQVHVGQEASLRFPTFDQRQTPEIFGYVSKISADVVRDDITGQPYYSAELLPKRDELAKLGDHNLLPGMPVEAFIRTGDRSPLAYLTKPMTDYFVRAFRE